MLAHLGGAKAGGKGLGTYLLQEIRSSLNSHKFLHFVLYIQSLDPEQTVLADEARLRRRATAKGPGQYKDKSHLETLEKHLCTGEKYKSHKTFQHRESLTDSGQRLPPNNRRERRPHSTEEACC